MNIIARLAFCMWIVATGIHSQNDPPPKSISTTSTYMDNTKGAWRQIGATLKNDHWEVALKCEGPLNDENAILTWHRNGAPITSTEDYRITNEVIDGQVFSTWTLTNFDHRYHDQYGCLIQGGASNNDSYIEYSTKTVPKINGTLEEGEVNATITLTCKAARGTSLYWKIPIPSQEDAVVVNDFDSSTNSQVSTIIFSVPKANQYQVFRCCAEHSGATPYSTKECSLIGYNTGVPTVIEHNIIHRDELEGYNLSCTVQGLIQQHTPHNIYWQLCNDGGCVNTTGIVKWPVNNYEFVTTLSNVKGYKTAACKMSNVYGEGNYEFDLQQGYVSAPQLVAAFSSFDPSTNTVTYTAVVSGSTSVTEWFRDYEYYAPLGVVWNDPYDTNTHPPELSIKSHVNSDGQLISQLTIKKWTNWRQFTTFSCRNTNDHGSVTSLPLKYHEPLYTEMDVSATKVYHGHSFSVNCTVEGQHMLPGLQVEVSAPQTVQFSGYTQSRATTASAYYIFRADKKNSPVYIRCYYNDFGRVFAYYREWRVEAISRCRLRNLKAVPQDMSEHQALSAEIQVA